MPSLNDLYRKLVPTNARLFTESLLGNKSPITEKDFSTDEIRAMVDLITSKAAKDNQYEQQLRQSVRSEPKYNEFPNQKDGSPVPYSDYLQEKQSKIGTFDKTRGKTSVTYEDYPTKSSPDSMGWIDSVKNSYQDPAYGVATSLGQFNAQDQGNAYQIQDQYNWNKSNNMTLQDLFELFKRPEAMGNALMRLGPGVDRPVNINIPK